MFIVNSIFNALGQHIFGGYVNDSLIDQLSTPINKNYILNNFNDIYMGWIFLFELLVVNNWNLNVFYFFKTYLLQRLKLK